MALAGLSVTTPASTSASLFAKEFYDALGIAESDRQVVQERDGAYLQGKFEDFAIQIF